MKFYVWENPYTVNYGASMLVVVANNLEEARRLAKDAPQHGWGEPSGANVDQKEPTRVLDLPCAELYEWSE